MSKPESTAGGAVFDLDAAERELRGEEAYVRTGHTGRTLVRERDLRIVLEVMQAGSRLPEHQADETASIHVVRGHVRLHISDRVIDLPAGSLLVLEPGLRHDVQAVDDSAFVLTLGWKQAV